jgi:chemotaxis protein methyltransferase CheR
VTDASFNEFQAILCCNALADFGPVLRQRVLRLFHDSLARFGVLCLDRPLSVTDAFAGTYQAVEGDRPWYKRIG